MKILSADDLAENRYFIEVLLKGNGHEVVSAANGEEALAALRQQPFDLLVTDLLMPRMDGFQLIQEMRHEEAFNHVAIVVYTATYTDARDEALVRSIGADSFIIKPVDPANLMATFETAVQRRREGKYERPAVPPAADEEKYILKQYNSRLIAKLEKKMVDLEKANRALLEDIAARIRAENERNELEEQLTRAQKAQAIGTLSSGIAHDFNNILTGILCAAELGAMESQTGMEVVETFDIIRSAGLRGRDLVRHILAFSRQQDVQKRPILLREVIQESLRFLRNTLPTTIKIHPKFPENPIWVMADATQIHQIVINLCTNAWHAIGDHHAGNIYLTLRQIEWTAGQAPGHLRLAPGSYLQFSVADDGCGMDETVRSRIFEPFFTTKPAGKGTGLGLSVVHHIMRTCDGAVNVESTPGQGSTFHLYFPVYLEALNNSAARPMAACRGNGERVLFVDDDPTLLRLADQMLKKLGYTPRVYNQTSEALKAFAAEGAEVVYVDLVMEEVDGLSFAQRVRELRPKVPVVIMSGFAASLEEKSIQDQGVTDFLAKPYDLETLAHSLSRVLKLT